MSIKKNIDEHFPYTEKGLEEATKWLKEIGEWEYVSTHGFSTDGITIVATANSMYSKRKKSNI